MESRRAAPSGCAAPRPSGAHFGLAALFLVLAAAPLAAQAEDRLTHLGELAPGTVSVGQSGPIYWLRFAGDEVIEYRIDTTQPNVLNGLLQVYEVSSDSWPIYNGQYFYRDAGGLRSVNYQAGFRIATNVTTTADSVVFDFTFAFPPTFETRHLRYTYSLAGKTLRIRIQELEGHTRYLDNWAGLLWGLTVGVEHPKYVKMQGGLLTRMLMFRNGSQHYFMSNMLDLFHTNAADYTQPQQPSTLGATTTNITYNLQTYDQYKPQSGFVEMSGSPDDTFFITVSSRVRDVLVTPTQDASPYRELLQHRLVFNFVQPTWSQYTPFWNRLALWGLHDIAGYFFTWTSSPADPPAPFNAGPDWYPAVDHVQFGPMLSAGVAKGFLLGVYTAFNTMPATAAPAVYDLSHAAQDASGFTKNHLQYTTIPLMALSACAIHADREMDLVATNYGANLAYLDIQTYSSPTRGSDGDHVDQRSGSPWAKGLRQALLDQKTWMRAMAERVHGPLLGEGSISGSGSNWEFLAAGYCDSVQRVINTGGGAGQGVPNTRRARVFAQTRWPVIPEYELRVFRLKQANHGNGIPDRFFGPCDGPGFVDGAGFPLIPHTEAMFDRSRIYQITYGKTAYLQSTGDPNGAPGNFLYHADVIKEYALMTALQERYFRGGDVTIEYWHQGKFKEFEEIFFQSETEDTFRDARLRLTYTSGLRIHLNHSLFPWVVGVGGIAYTIPEDGFVADDAGDGFLCFSASHAGTGGQRIDYCLAPGEHEFFDGRGVVSGFGGLSTPFGNVVFRNFSLDTTCTENAVGGIVVAPGSPPALTRIDVLPAAVTLEAGRRRGLRAIATYANGAVRNVTTLVDWSSTSPAAATVDEGAALRALASGTTTIQVTSLAGAATFGCTVTVP